MKTSSHLLYPQNIGFLASSLACEHSSWHSGSRKHSSPSSVRFSRLHFLPREKSCNASGGSGVNDDGDGERESEVTGKVRSSDGSDGQEEN